MVTDDERDYMYLAYSADPRMRINLGIRRRLAPLVDNNRRRIELLNSLLLSFPARRLFITAMKSAWATTSIWATATAFARPCNGTAIATPDSRAPIPRELFSPVIMDPVWGYQAINVEAQQSDPSSLLNWMRNMIALRKLFQVFGRGIARIPESGKPQNPCLSARDRRRAGPVHRESLALRAARRPGSVRARRHGAGRDAGLRRVPAYRRQPYRFTLGPYGFLWLELQAAKRPEAAEITPAQRHHLRRRGMGRACLKAPRVIALKPSRSPNFSPSSAGSAAKRSRIRSTRVLIGVPTRPDASLAMVEVQYESGPSDIYSLPLSIALQAAADQLRDSAPNAMLAAIATPSGTGVLYDGLLNDAVCASLLEWIGSRREIQTRNGKVRGEPGSAFANLSQAPGPLPFAAAQPNRAIPPSFMMNALF